MAAMKDVTPRGAATFENPMMRKGLLERQRYFLAIRHVKIQWIEGNLVRFFNSRITFIKLSFNQWEFYGRLSVINQELQDIKRNTSANLL
jgi:hypothetical protein